LNVDFQPCPGLIARMLKQMIIGRSLPDDLDDVLSEIEGRIFYKGKKALITAIKETVRELREFQNRATQGFLSV